MARGLGDRGAHKRATRAHPPCHRYPALARQTHFGDKSRRDGVHRTQPSGVIGAPNAVHRQQGPRKPFSLGWSADRPVREKKGFVRVGMCGYRGHGCGAKLDGLFILPHLVTTSTCRRRRCSVRARWNPSRPRTEIPFATLVCSILPSRPQEELVCPAAFGKAERRRPPWMGRSRPRSRLR